MQKRLASVLTLREGLPTDGTHSTTSRLESADRTVTRVSDRAGASRRMTQKVGVVQNAGGLGRFVPA